VERVTHGSRHASGEGQNGGEILHVDVSSVSIRCVTENDRLAKLAPGLKYAWSQREYEQGIVGEKEKDEAKKRMTLPLVVTQEKRRKRCIQRGPTREEESLRGG
jgi:hypothetical protein